MNWRIDATGLVDSRRGFGRQASWKAHYPILGRVVAPGLRLDLDHVLVGKGFAVLDRRLLPEDEILRVVSARFRLPVADLNETDIRVRDEVPEQLAAVRPGQQRAELEHPQVAQRSFWRRPLPHRFCIQFRASHRQQPLRAHPRPRRLYTIRG